jgi:tripartite ATP-independent transporter DctP family solute receptor
MAAVLGLAAAGPVQAQEARTLRMGTISAANSPWADAMREFARIVEERSGGRLDVEIYTDGQLGDMQQLLAGMQLGTIEMAYFGLGVATFLKGAEKLKVIYTPYLFDSKEDAARILNSDEFHQIYEEIAQATGIRILGAYGDRSPRAIQTTKGPITKPEDVKGLRLRVPGIDIFERTFETLGAQVTPLGMTEIYTALSRGIVDGQDNGFDLSLPLKFHEVAKYWSATDHAYEVTGWYVSESVWQSLSDEDRAILSRAAEEAGAVATEGVDRLDASAIETLKAAGVTYTIPDRDAFREALADVYKEFEGKVWPDGLVEKIRAMQGH